MALSDQQIERYSRQILVAGGVAQERLLAARIALSGSARDVEPALRYLVGAGVGRIGLQLVGAPIGEDGAAAHDQLIAMARALDANVAMQSAERMAAEPDLRLMIIGNAAVLAVVKAQGTAIWHAALVAVRLDSPARILVFPNAGRPSPGREAELFAAWSPPTPSDTTTGQTGLVTMVAVTEVLKLLTQPTPEAAASIIEFEGYQTRRLTKDAPA